MTGGDALPESPAWVARSYINMADDRMEGILKTITEAESNVLFFCTAGKDRTGVVAVLLQRRAGCSEEYILQDYLLSGRNLAPPIWNNTPGQTPASIWQSSPRSARPWSGSSAR